MPSAIVSELLSNVSALSNALDNSRDGSATSSSLNVVLRKKDQALKEACTSKRLFC